MRTLEDQLQSLTSEQQEFPEERSYQRNADDEHTQGPRTAPWECSDSRTEARRCGSLSIRDTGKTPKAWAGRRRIWKENHFESVWKLKSNEEALQILNETIVSVTPLCTRGTS